MQKLFHHPVFKLIIKLILAAAIIYISAILGLFIMLFFGASQINVISTFATAFIVPTLLLGLLFIKKRKLVLKVWGIFTLLTLTSVTIDAAINEYDRSITINPTPNINIHEYLPFKEESEIVHVPNASLKLTENLPIVDGAAAVFPVYSAFVEATYPETTQIYDGVFEYNNTVGGYKLLGEKAIDIFFGAYPSKQQIEDAKEKGTEFEYTEIGKEAFVFFVHKDNPVTSLSADQIRKIYSGEITNWKEVGGNDEKILPFQRNEGSGSQSMLIRFMDGTPIMEAPTELVNDLMSGIIEKVSDYRNKKGSIGFSFRYYLEGIIKNPDIKMIAIDGIAPTIENIQNQSYPVTTPLYAVTYKDNPNENVQKLIDWVLSYEGQFIIEKTGYTPIHH